jgi:ATP-dependent Clp protease ATP-binding subunit ClpA
MFERFTDRARRVIVLAQEEARLLGHSYIGTEHLAAGLVHEGEGIAGLVLTEAGVNLEGVRKLVIDRIGENPNGPRGHIPFTPRMRKVIELSLREALNLGHNYVGTEHLLLGLEREGQGTGIQILDQLGVQDLRRRVMDKILGLEFPIAVTMRRFVLQRSEDVSGVSGIGTVAEGAQFSDLKVVVRWISGDHRSTVVWDDIESVLAIHGHDGRTVVRWLDA